MKCHSFKKVFVVSVMMLLCFTQAKSQTAEQKKQSRSFDFFNRISSKSTKEIIPESYFIPDEYKENVFFDDFSTNKNNWTMVIDERSFRKIENGYLNYWSSFTNDPKYWRSAFCLKNIDIDETKNFEIEVSIKCTQYGVSIIPLIWGRNTENLNTYYFGFSSNDEFQIMKYENNDFSPFTKLNKTTALLTNDFNKLTIRKFGDKLYFFINEVLVHQMPVVKLPGNEFGFQAPSNSTVIADYIRLSYIGDLNYEKKIKAIVLDRNRKWLLKGKFEKMADYEHRVNPSTKNKMIAKLVQETIDSIGNTVNKFELRQNEYNPELEQFKIYFNTNDTLAIHVPIKEASSFDQNFSNLIVRPRFTLENNTFPLVYMDLINPRNNKT